MQNNFECIFKLVVALTFLMCVVCSHYQYSFLMFYIIFLFSFFFVCFIFLNERQQKERKKKKKRKKVESRNKFSIWKPLRSNYFFILIIKVMVSATEASIGILKVMYKHNVDNNEDACFKDRHIYIFNCKNKYQYFLKYLFDPE